MKYCKDTFLGKRKIISKEDSLTAFFFLTPT